VGRDRPATLVDLHLVVRERAGTVLADDRVGHRFTIAPA
jgi:hypothetical protein